MSTRAALLVRGSRYASAHDLLGPRSAMRSVFGVAKGFRELQERFIYR
jgi:hypothetical protein